MIPHTYPTSVVSGKNAMQVGLLSSITGLRAWIDYIPVKLVTQSTTVENTFSITGYRLSNAIEITNKQAWLDYIPIYDVSANVAFTKPWSTDIGGYIPIYGDNVSPILSLFANGEQGVWYDPSDFSTMFQDSAGTTPVTAVEQPVGRILDKSGRGNHATQSTSAARPTLSARVNMLLATETLATQSVTTVATNYTLTFTGTGSITLSGTKIGVYTAGTHTITGVTAGTLTLTVLGTVTKADLRAANVNVGIPSYQRVNTATDYDTAGFPMYLLFDGVDDWLVTPSIDFTSTDKMTVFAGVRKLRDGTGYGRIVDLAQSTANRNNFILTAPWDLNTGSYGMQTNGSGASVQGYIASGFSAPISSVITSQHDIALSATTGAVRMRINKVEQNLQTTGSTTGGGTFTNNRLVIGKGSSLNIFQLNARLYSLIVRGAQSSEAQILSAETYCNQKTGAY